jgi:hypothetical protein
MSCTVGGSTPLPATWQNGLAANHALRKSKMSCAESVPEPSKSAWQQGTLPSPSALQALPPAANRAPTPDCGGTHADGPRLVEHVDPRQQTPTGGQTLFGSHTVFGPRHVPPKSAQSCAGTDAQLVAVQHAPDGVGHVIVTHVEAIPWNVPAIIPHSACDSPAVHVPLSRQHAPIGQTAPVPHATRSPMYVEPASWQADRRIIVQEPVPVQQAPVGWGHDTIAHDEPSP